MVSSTVWAAAMMVAAGQTPPASQSDAGKTHALIISIDGMRGDYCANPDKHGLKIPTLRKLMSSGVVAQGVRGVFPSVTYPSHTSLITGCRPGRHGILANGVFDPPTTRQSERWYWDYKDIQVPTLFDAARKAGWSTASVSWPVTVNAPVDVLFPEVWEPGQFGDRVVAIDRATRPAQLVASVLTRYDLGPGVGKDGMSTNVARYVLDKYKPRLMALHLIEVDEAEHSAGPNTPKAYAAIEQADAHIGQVLAACAKAGLLDRTLVAIVSDHGFLAVEKSFQVNVVLRRAGLIDAPEDRKPARDYVAAGWVTGGSCAIMLNNPEDARALERVRAALAPYAGKPDSPIRRILERDEIATLGSNPRAALMLDPADGFTFGSRMTGEPVTKASTRGMHGQLPDREGLEACLILSGPGVPNGRKCGEVQMVDIAPTLAAMLRLEMPAAEGRPIADIRSAAVAP